MVLHDLVSYDLRSKGQQGYSGTFLDGRFKITVRKKSTYSRVKVNGKIIRDGRPTLEIRSNTGGKIVRKIRYENSRSFQANKAHYQYKKPKPSVSRPKGRQRINRVRHSGSRSRGRAKTNAPWKSGYRLRNGFRRNAGRQSGTRGMSRRFGSRRRRSGYRSRRSRSRSRRSGSRRSRSRG